MAMAKIALKGLFLLSIKPDDFEGTRLLARSASSTFFLDDLNCPIRLFDLDRRFWAGIKAESIRALMADLGDKKRTFRRIGFNPDSRPFEIYETLIG
jgi:hypothetical protein